MKETTQPSNALTLRFQWVTLSITTLLIAILVAGQLKKFCSADGQPHIESLTPKTLKQFVATPAPVTVGLTITDFPVFDVANNEFQFDGIIWFTYDPALIGLDTIKQFSFVKGKIDYTSDPITRLDGDLITVRYNIRATFRSDIYYGYFPFEDHTLYIMLANMSVNPDELSFTSSYANVIIDEPYITGWYYTDHRVSSGYSTIPLGIGHKSKEIAYPSVLFAIDFFHHSIRYVIAVLLPLLIIFFIDLFSLCFDQERDPETLAAITTANIAALVAYRFVIESLTPRVGYPTIADYLYFLFLTNTFIIFMVNCVGPYLSILHKKVVSIILQSSITAAIFYLLTIWIPC